MSSSSVVAALLSAAISLSVRTALAQKDHGQDVLEGLVKATGLSYFIFEGTERPVYIVAFKADNATGVDRWLVRVAYNNARKNWICVSCTVLDMDDNYSFPARLKDRLLRYNSEVPGSKFSWDEKNGDIDVEWEVPTHLATSSLLEAMIRDVAATCDSEHDELAALLK